MLSGSLFCFLVQCGTSRLGLILLICMWYYFNNMHMYSVVLIWKERKKNVL